MNYQKSCVLILKSYIYINLNLKLWFEYECLKAYLIIDCLQFNFDFFFINFNQIMSFNTFSGWLLKVFIKIIINSKNLMRTQKFDLHIYDLKAQF